MAKKIRLMADYGCDPLWWEESEKVGDIELATLPLREETIRRLDRWAKAYDALLNWDDPALSGFVGKQEEAAFEREGVSLWKLLREELAPDYEVLYFSDQLQKLFNDPSELELVSSS